MGALDLVSALTPPFRERLEILTEIMPMQLPEAATAVTAVAGILLLLVARGLRAGQHRAWVAAVAVLGVSSVLHLVKGGDIEEAVLSAIVLGILVASRRAFTGTGDELATRWCAGVLAVGVVGGVAVATTAIELMRRPDLSLPTAVAAASERLVGVSSIRLPRHMNAFLTPTLGALGALVAITAVLMVLRPAIIRRRTNGDVERARAVVHRYGRDTLAYFALRDDKHFFFWGSTVVSYAVFGTVCLVSPDPIGPDDERRTAWEAFHRYADDHGWAVAVLGASEEWLATYASLGMRHLYLGDEGIVDCTSLCLDGGKHKSLRQAVNRVASTGTAASSSTRPRSTRTPAARSWP